MRRDRIVFNNVLQFCMAVIELFLDYFRVRRSFLTAFADHRAYHARLRQRRNKNKVYKMGTVAWTEAFHGGDLVRGNTLTTTMVPFLQKGQRQGLTPVRRSNR